MASLFEAWWVFPVISIKGVPHYSALRSLQNPSDVPNESRPPPPLLKIPVPVHGHEEVPASTGEPSLEQSPQGHSECKTRAHSSHPSPTSPPHVQSTPASPQGSSDGRKIIAQILEKWVWLILSVFLQLTVFFLMRCT